MTGGEPITKAAAEARIGAVLVDHLSSLNAVYSTILDRLAVLEKAHGIAAPRQLPNVALTVKEALTR